MKTSKSYCPSCPRRGSRGRTRKRAVGFLLSLDLRGHQTQKGPVNAGTSHERWWQSCCQELEPPGCVLLRCLLLLQLSPRQKALCRRPGAARSAASGVPGQRSGWGTGSRTRQPRGPSRGAAGAPPRWRTRPLGLCWGGPGRAEELGDGRRTGKAWWGVCTGGSSERLLSLLGI